MPTSRCRPVPLSATVRPTRTGGTAGFAGDADRTADRLGDEIERLVARPSAAARVAADRGDDQTRKAPPQRADFETEAVEGAGGEVLGQHIGGRQQFEQRVATALALEVEDDAALVLIEQPVHQAVALGGGAGEGAAGVALGRLDLEHVCPQHREHLRRRGARLELRQIDDAHPGERQLRVGSFRHSRGIKPQNHPKTQASAGGCGGSSKRNIGHR